MQKFPLAIGYTRRMPIPLIYSEPLTGEAPVFCGVPLEKTYRVFRRENISVCQELGFFSCRGFTLISFPLSPGNVTVAAVEKEQKLNFKR